MTSNDIRQRALHRRAFDELSAHNGPAALRAHHALAAGLEGHAFHALLEAGDKALKDSKFRDAIAFYECARELSHDVLINPALYLQLGRVYELLNEPLAAQHIYETLLTLAQADQNSIAETAALERLEMLPSHVSDSAHCK